MRKLRFKVEPIGDTRKEDDAEHTKSLEFVCRQGIFNRKGKIKIRYSQNQDGGWIINTFYYELENIHPRLSDSLKSECTKAFKGIFNID